MQQQRPSGFLADFIQSQATDGNTKQAALKRLRTSLANPEKLQTDLARFPDQARSTILLRRLLEELASKIWTDGKIPPRAERVLRDLQLKERPSFDLVCSMVAELHDGLSDVDGDFPPDDLIVLVALARAMAFIAKWLHGDGDARLPRVFSVQEVAWLYAAIWREDFGRLLAIDWKDEKHTTQLIERNKKLRAQLFEIVEHANSLLFEKEPRIRSCVESLCFDKSRSYAVGVISFAPSFIVALELLPAELVVDDAGMRTLGLWDEFRRREEME